MCAGIPGLHRFRLASEPWQQCRASLTVTREAMMKAGLQAYVDLINAGDAQGVTALFSTEATIEDPVGSPIKRGSDIAAWFKDTIAFNTRIHPVAPIRGSHGAEAALAFDVEFTPPGGKRMRIRSLDVCTFDEQGRITSLRGFWGPSDMEVIEDEA